MSENKQIDTHTHTHTAHGKKGNKELPEKQMLLISYVNSRRPLKNTVASRGSTASSLETTGLYYDTFSVYT